MEFGVLFWVSLLAFVSLGHGQEEEALAPAAEPVITAEEVMPVEEPVNEVFWGPDPEYPPVDPTAYPPDDPPGYPPVDLYPPETEYVTSTGEAYPPPSGYPPVSDYLPPKDYPPSEDPYVTVDEYIPPDVIYPPSYSKGDPFAGLWEFAWIQVHFMKYKVDSVEDYRDKMMLKINKLSHKVFAWCRCEKHYFMLLIKTCCTRWLDLLS